MVMSLQQRGELLCFSPKTQIEYMVEYMYRLCILV